MITETSILMIVTSILTAWNGYLHYKMTNICKTCVYDYKPKNPTMSDKTLSDNQNTPNFLKKYY